MSLAEVFVPVGYAALAGRAREAGGLRQGGADSPQNDPRLTALGVSD